MRQILSIVIGAENRTVVFWGWTGREEQRNLGIGSIRAPANWANRLYPALAAGISNFEEKSKMKAIMKSVFLLGSIAVGAWLAIIGASYVPQAQAQLMPNCPDGVETGWQWTYLGISMTGGILHQNIKFLITSAIRQPNTTIAVPNTNPQWFAAWYDLNPDPAESVIFQESFGKTRYLWRENEALMRCEIYPYGNFLLIPVQTKGRVEAVHMDTDCDDPSQGCDNPEGGAAGVQPGTPGAGGPRLGDQEVSYRCDIYYEYDLQTGEIVYWTVLGCYIA